MEERGLFLEQTEYAEHTQIAGLPDKVSRSILFKNVSRYHDMGHTSKCIKMVFNRSDYYARNGMFQSVHMHSCITCAWMRLKEVKRKRDIWKVACHCFPGQFIDTRPNIKVLDKPCQTRGISSFLAKCLDSHRISWKIGNSETGKKLSNKMYDCLHPLNTDRWRLWPCQNALSRKNVDKN